VSQFLLILFNKQQQKIVVLCWMKRTLQKKMILLNVELYPLPEDHWIKENLQVLPNLTPENHPKVSLTKKQFI
jgi:hypothetical protein